MAESNLTKLRNHRNSVTSTPYRAGASESEVVDIISDYPWTADGINNNTKTSLENSGGSFSVNSLVPFCFVVERRSAVNAALANVFNMLNAADDIVSSAGEAISGVNQKVGDCMMSMYDSAKKAIAEFMGSATGWTAKFKELMTNNNLNTDLLNPYRYMYITATTNKKYVFPLYTTGNTFAPIKNNWSSAAPSLPGILGQAVDTAQNFLTGVGAGFNFMRNVINLGKDGGSDIGTVVDEKPKQYTYPVDGDTIKVSFTLYNTTKQDAWKNNFRFLYLFTFRNLPFRLDALAYEPPFLYDVIIPGVSRYPVCTISSLSIQPQGMTRMMKLANFIPAVSSSDILVAVPEAWTVTIDFTSLLGQTGNLMLSALSGSFNISTSTDTAPAANPTNQPAANPTNQPAASAPAATPEQPANK